MSQGIRWLNVRDAIEFTWAHRCHGTVFRGRFKGVWIHEDGEAVEVARSVLPSQAGTLVVTRFAQPLAADPARQRLVAQFGSEVSTI